MQAAGDVESILLTGSGCHRSRREQHMPPRTRRVALRRQRWRMTGLVSHLSAGVLRLRLRLRLKRELRRLLVAHVRCLRMARQEASE